MANHLLIQSFKTPLDVYLLIYFSCRKFFLNDDGETTYIPIEIVSTTAVTPNALDREDDKTPLNSDL
eukprot:9667383-Ditylum_brightwellii.AAC.1